MRHSNRKTPRAPRRLVTSGTVLGLVLGATCSGMASAAPAPLNICVQTPAVVPGLFGPPQWFGLGAQTQLNEPRWAGAPLVSFQSDPANSGTGVGGYRLLVDNARSELDVALEAVEGDAIQGNDSVFFGFQVGLHAQLVQIKIDPSGGNDPLAAPVGDVTLWDNPTGGSTPSSWTSTAGTIPTWLTQTGIWRRSPSGAYWGVQFKVNLRNAGISASSSFKAFLGLSEYLNGGYTPVSTPDASAVPVASLIGSVTLPNAKVIASTPAPADPSQWATIQPLSNTCTGGITLESTQIGTRNVPSDVVSTDANATNYFYAQPTYSGMAVVPPNIVRGRIRVAEWGSNIGVGADSQWQLIDVPSTSTSPGTFDFVNNGVGMGANGPVASDTIEFACDRNGSAGPVPSGTTCGISNTQFLPSDTNAHQCIQVELAPVPGPNPVSITTPNAFRNMRWDTLSTKQWPATISIQGLTAVTGQIVPYRDVYLHVFTHNMPPVGNSLILLDTINMALTQFQATHGCSILDFLFGSSLSAEQKLKAVWPTYDVHVSYDTTKQFIGPQGIIGPWLQPMVPYKYYLSHDGLLFGFQTAINGLTPGAPLTSVGTNAYKVRIPSEGSVQVQSGVSASEVPAALLGGAAELVCAIFPWAC